MFKIDLWEILKNIWLLLWKFWPLWVILLALAAVRVFFDWLDLEIDNWHIRRRFKKGEGWRSDRDLLRWLRGMKPAEFEDYIADLFRRLGYKTQVTGGSYDEGVDVVAEKDGIKHYIQCKKFITSQVSVGAVRDFYGAIADHLATGKGYFITTNKFTLEAENFAQDKPIELVDGYGLIKYIRLAKKDIEATAPKFEEQKCPDCGGNLVEKEGKFGKFYGCSNYPRCRFTKNIA